MSETPTFWTNDDGYILVDDNGAPFFGTSCPCGAACWQRYEVSCIDNEGSDVYGDSGTGKTSEAHWDTPIMTEWKCGGTSPTSLGVLNHWIQDAPGFAHIWTSVDLGSSTTVSSCKEACSIPHTVSQPDLPCSCVSIWGGSDVTSLPNYSYFINKWRFIGWSVTGTTSSIVSSAIMPVWEYNKFASGNYDKITGSRYTVTRGYHFLANFSSGDYKGPQSYCGSDQTEWSSTHSANSYGSYPLYRISSTTDANGYYVPLPYKNYIFAYRGSSNTWIENGHLYIVSSMYKDPIAGTSELSCCISELTPGFSSEMVSSFASVHSMGNFATSFTSEQFGHISVYVSTTDDHIHPFIVREARGAQVPMQDIDIQTQTLVTGRYEGSPLWYYRTFITTDWDIEPINQSNWEYALSSVGSVVSIVRGTTFTPGVICPEYWFLYMTQAWKACVPDTDPMGLPFTDPGVPCVPGAYCMPPTYMENTVPDGRYSPPPYSLNYNSTATNVGWTHEVDESLDQNGSPIAIPGLRALNVSTDEHAYKVSRLSIKNYPTWYGSDVKCATSLNGALWEIPQMDMSDSAWFRRRGCYGNPEKRGWPDVYDSRPSTSCSCAYYSIAEVKPQDVLLNGRQPNWFIRTIMFDQTYSYESSSYEDIEGSTQWNTWVVFPTSYIAQYGQGCPENMWSAVMYWSSANWGKCCITSAGNTQWVDTPRVEHLNVSTGYCGRDGRCDWGLPGGSFTWQGNIPNSELFCSSSGYTVDNVSIYGLISRGGSNYPDSNTVEYWSQSDPELWVYEYTTSHCVNPSCTASNNISTIAKYVIKRGDAELIIDDTTCPPVCSPFVEGETISIVVSCSAYWTKHINYKIEDTIPNGYASSPGPYHALPDGTFIDEINNGGTIDLDFEWSSDVRLEYSAQYTGEVVFTWHESIGSTFTVPLSNIYITQTWVTDAQEYKHCSYTLSENLSVASEISPDDDGYVTNYYSWGGRQYRNDSWYSRFTDTTPVSLVSSVASYWEAGRVSISVYNSDEACEVRINHNAFDMGTPDDEVSEALGPNLPPTDWIYHWSQPWTPQSNSFYITAVGSYTWSGYYGWIDGHQTNYLPNTWHSTDSTINNSYYASALLDYYDYFIPAISEMSPKEYDFEYKPWLLSPCNYRGYDLMDEAPEMGLSSYNRGNLDAAVNSAYNSASCYAQWSSTTNYPWTSATETFYREYNWSWAAEWEQSACVNPDLMVGGSN